MRFQINVRFQRSHFAHITASVIDLLSNTYRFTARVRTQSYLGPFVRNPQLRCLLSFLFELSSSAGHRNKHCLFRLGIIHFGVIVK